MDASIEFLVTPKDPNDPITVVYTCPYCCTDTQVIQVQIHPDFREAFGQALASGEGVPIKCWDCKKDLTLTTSSLPQFDTTDDKAVQRRPNNMKAVLEAMKRMLGG